MTENEEFGCAMMPHYVYRVMTATNNIGMSTAAGLLQNVVGFICIISVNKIVQKIDEDSSLF